MAAPRSLHIATLFAFGVVGCVVSFDGYRLDERADAGSGGSSGGPTGGAGGASGAGGSAGIAAGGSSGGVGGSAGASGSGGTAGASGSAGSGGSSGAGGCPSKTGAELIPVPDTAGGVYCIDKTEVTRDQYFVFYNSQPSTSGQIAECAGNNSFLPDDSGECQGVVAPSTLGNHPIVCVDWCDAYAYCKAVGKRLCGSHGGGPVSAGGHTDATTSQWFNACSAGGARTYPYGNLYDAQRCNGLQATAALATAPTGGLLFPQCQGGFDNLYDMSGNASEWEDGCVGSDCPSRGGNYNVDWDTAPESLKCSSAWLAPRMQTSKYRGFRCCWDASVP